MSYPIKQPGPVKQEPPLKEDFSKKIYFSKLLVVELISKVVFPLINVLGMIALYCVAPTFLFLNFTTTVIFLTTSVVAGLIFLHNLIYVIKKANEILKEKHIDKNRSKIEDEILEKVTFRQEMKQIVQEAARELLDNQMDEKKEDTSKESLEEC